MTRCLLACFLALSLGACASVPQTDMTALSKSAYAAKATYVGLLVIAEGYNQRPPCGGTVIICRDQAVVDQMRKASAAADAATQAGENAVRSLGSNPAVVSAAVTAAQQAVGAFKVITDTYSAKGQ